MLSTQALPLHNRLDARPALRLYLGAKKRWLRSFADASNGHRTHDPIRCATIAWALEHLEELDLEVDTVHIREESVQ